jgi:GntR family transcriptional regulator/MocR family aminotransferase
MARSKQQALDGSNHSAAGTDSSKLSGSDFLQLNIAAAPAGGRADLLARELRNAIADRRLGTGTTLPASRVLAAELAVSRGVVTEAYQRLTDEGLLAGQGRRGTVVIAGVYAGPRSSSAAAGDDVIGTDPRPVGEPSTGTRPTVRTRTTVFSGAADNSMFDALRTADARIDLTPGAPDLAAFPRAGWLRAERTVLTELPADAFGYPDPQGASTFRRSVAGWLARNRGMSVEEDQVVVVAGVAQALALLARVLRAEGIDRIAVEDPGSRGARLQLQSWGMATPAIPVDGSGIQVDALRNSNARAVLLTPAHQFPTGVVLDGTRRRELQSWAADGGLVIEDDYDAEHRYDRPPTPALHSLMPEQVCYTGSVSKLLAPALRVGWLLVPARYQGAIVAAKRETDLGNAVLTQLVLGRMFDSGDLERHLRLVRRRHRGRRDAMVAAIGEHLPDARIHGAAAGLHLTITFPGRTAISDVAVAVAALEAGIKVHPLSWHRQRPGPAGLVLGYGASSVSEIADGIRILADVIAGADG